MTTVVCNREYMASDSQISRSNLTVGGIAKLFRGPDGSVLGLCGTWVVGAGLIDWLCGRADAPPSLIDDEDDWNVLWLRRDGLWLIEDRSFRLVPAGADAYAIGSGAQLALGAMAMGATPQQAVKVAAQFDMYTGGRIKTMALETGRKKKK